MTEEWRNNTEWRLTEKQYDMIRDKVTKLSKKEASLLIRIIQAILDSRTSSLKQFVPVENKTG